MKKQILAYLLALCGIACSTWFLIRHTTDNLVATGSSDLMASLVSLGLTMMLAVSGSVVGTISAKYAAQLKEQQ